MAGTSLPDHIDSDDTATLRSRGAVRSNLRWGLLGFLAGALFWHLIGFWQFLGQIVYNAPNSSQVQTYAMTATFSARPADAPLAAIERSARLNAQNCVTLVRDPLSGTTTAQKCTIVIRSTRPSTQASARAQTAGRLDLVASDLTPSTHSR